MAARRSENVLNLEGCNYFRQRLILATLSGKSIRIKKIRHKDDEPGIREFEASFIRLIDKVTNGSRIEVNESGKPIIGGCVDSRHQSLALLLMVLGEKDISKILTGPLSTYTIQFLRHLRDFFQVMFKIETQLADEDEDRNTGGDKIVLSCLGVGFSNLNKTIL
uniref:RNA 3'-terminal phosphate cyclase-like protein-like n=1 Tax=Saccoglossus kowalevskii TaxID=10224 RepID=A0ABM0MQG5_SACKO|nr:PREDICTED: RNA 3'-terminal phosphate cyclase-like protein-like [Saccoglossus kowalevskii]